jgi:hypothetical protein
MTMDRLHCRPEANYQKQDVAKRAAVRALSFQEGNGSDVHFELYLNMILAFTPIAHSHRFGKAELRRPDCDLNGDDSHSTRPAYSAQFSNCAGDFRR